MIDFIMKAGKDFVRSQMTEEFAKTLLENGKRTESEEFKDFPICIDKTYYFRKEQTSEQQADKTEKPSRKKRP